MKKHIFHQFQDMNALQFKRYTVLFSVLMSEMIVASMGMLLKGYVPVDYLLMGLIVSFFVAFLVVSLLLEFREQFIESELQLRTIIETDPECVKLLAVDGSLLQMNRAGLAMIEADSEHQVVGNNIKNILLPKYRPAFVELIRQVFKGETGNLEFEIQGMKGTHRWLESHAVPLRDSEGNITALLSVTRDITEHKHAIEKLQKSEEQLQLVLAGGHLGFWDWNLLTNEVERNVIWAEMLGYTYEEIKHTTQQWEDFVYPDDRDRAWQSIDNALKGNTPYHEVEYRMLHKDGSIRWVLDHASVVQRDSNGQPTRMTGTHTDITQLKRMEQQLRDSENKLNIILDNVEAYIYIKDCNYQYQYVNQRVLQLFGQPLAAIIGKMDKDFFDSATAANLRDNDSRIIEHGERLATEEINVSKDGVICNAYLSVKQPLRREDGTIYALCGISTDITERKKMEQQLRDNEAFISSILDSLTAYISVLNSEGMILAVNKAWRQFAEDNDFYETDYDIVGANYFSVCQKAINRLNNEDITAIQDGIMAVLSGIRDHFYLEYPCHTPTEKRWFCMNVSPLKGARSGIVISHENITIRKQTETQLRIAATVFEAQEGMLITDTNSVILNVNQAFTQITGYSAAEVIGQTPRLLRSGRHDKAFYIDMWQHILDTGVWKGEIWNQRKNGEIYPQWMTITAVKSNNGTLVTHYVATLTDITERKLTEEHINQLAFYDPLTQLPNRRLLQERLRHAIDVSHRTGSQIAVLMLDLDKFKAVNDSFGHAVGDELLQQVAARIKARLRETDTVVRLGGDEFVVLMEEIEHDEHVVYVASDLIDTLTQLFTVRDNCDAYIGVSIGIAIYPQHGNSVEALLDNADVALYHAKDEGRGCFAYFSEELTQQARERIALEARLRRAIEQRELQVYFQPQIDINSNRIIGAEALVRWHDPVKGWIMPSDFIPLAEETGLIIPLGDFVLKETCRLGRQWLDEGLPAVTLAVNVSPHQFRRSDINALVAAVLHDTGFPAGSLELEITESGLMDNQQHAMAILNTLHNQGVRIAIDDFGTGYSSLAYLKYFPLDVLKIDKTFIDDIPFLQGDMAITAAIIAMAHHLGFKVLAEGVETAEQLAFLRQHGCDLYQGYFCSKPVPASDFVKLLLNGLNSSTL
ncbi:MAG: EAL domain-containing protein [Methylococcales bacterium]|nr:EAL domain-containing protein [Methylococcales bacterium]